MFQFLFLKIHFILFLVSPFERKNC
uniref:Uncharacterized protein n=1 Tax=Anguilla anguilla TaxID=7936 RepID=A0A0E9QF40_ANGAN